MEIHAAGEVFVMHLGSVQRRVTEPVLYLDQNHWIDFARWHKNATALSAAKRVFFERLATAANAGHVIIPLSSAHLTETAKRGGATRLELASTMLRYSRGWQMRSVLGLRRAELRALFASSSALNLDDVITLAPGAVLDQPRLGPCWQHLGAELAGLLERQVWATTLVDLLVDSEPGGAAGSEAANWAESFRPLVAAMKGNARAKAHSRDLTRVRFMSDLGNDLPAAAKESGATPEQFARWLEDDAERAVAAAPGLGRMRETMHLRLMNADDKWEANDLNDWMHLSYAAAYCDLVLGERKTINYLRRCTPKVPLGAILHRRAADALGDLELILAGRDGDR